MARPTPMTGLEITSKSPGLSQRWINQLDPRTRIIGAFSFALAVVSVEVLIAKLAALLTAFVIGLLVGLTPLMLLRRLLALEAFLLVLLIIIPFTIPGEAALTFFGFSATHEGIFRALQIAATAMSVALVMVSLLGTLSAVTFGHALSHLGVSAKLVQLFLFTVRYTETLKEEYGRLRMAMRARGFRPGSNLHTWRSLGWLIGMLLVRGMRRAERIHDAMLCRGFTGRFPTVRQGDFGARDCVAAIGWMLVIALMIVLELFY